LVGNPNTALLSGGPLNVQYEFVEMHFHWGEAASGSQAGSEHTLDGKTFPLELHMVHKNVHDASLAEAVTHENGLCVLGFFFEVLVECDTSPLESDITTTGLDSLLKIVGSHLTAANSVIDIDTYNAFSLQSDVNVGNFLPPGVSHLAEEYFTYKGSLTTGGHEEAVNWVVFRRPFVVKKWHLAALETMKNKSGERIVNNFRQTLPVNDRPIYYQGTQLLERGIVNRGNPVGLRSVQPAPLLIN